jgi:Response regulator of the LytR/AlgR family
MIKCAIIDDEPLSRDILRQFIEDHPDLSLTAEYKDALEAISGLERQSVDLLLLDINMPKLSGVNFYKSLQEKPLVIFTTAYPEFALEGFELDAVDYLMKPIAFDRFLQAIQKVKNRLKTTSEETPEHIMLKVDKKLYRAAFDDILYLEAFGDYAKVHLIHQVLIITSTMKRLEAELPSELFVRTHKSYLINISKVEFIEGNQVKIGSGMIPIGLRYREVVLGKLR